ncbi:MAG: RDD family protein [Ketobacteraceae bacterium]|nr:RDD family protein [Ketobacteraceae bacterium]
MLDTYQQLETPESIDLELRIAGPVVRILAFAIDTAIKTVFLIVANMVLMFAEKVGLGVMMILAFLVEWFYPVAFEVLRNGQTPGKGTMGILVIHDNGTPVGWTSSVIRNLLRFVDFLPVGYLLGLITMACNRHFKRLGDLAAGTMVIYQREKPRQTRIREATPLPPTCPLTLDEQRAFINFAERQESLTADRQQEIANHLSPVVRARDQSAVDKIIRIANWLKGAR